MFGCGGKVAMAGYRAYDSDWIDADSAATLDAGPGNLWGSPNNARYYDGAFSVNLMSGSMSVTDILYLYNYDFSSIPINAIITGLTFRSYCRAPTSTTWRLSIGPAGDNYGAVDTTDTNSWITHTHVTDSPDTYTRAGLESFYLYVVCSRQTTGSTQNAYVDVVQTKVHYLA